jgi:hypothetical protein
MLERTLAKLYTKRTLRPMFPQPREADHARCASEDTAALARVKKTPRRSERLSVSSLVLRPARGHSNLVGARPVAPARAPLRNSACPSPDAPVRYSFGSSRARSVALLPRSLRHLPKASSRKAGEQDSKRAPAERSAPLIPLSRCVVAASAIWRCCWRPGAPRLSGEPSRRAFRGRRRQAIAPSHSAEAAAATNGSERFPLPSIRSGSCRFASAKSAQSPLCRDGTEGIQLLDDRVRQTQAIDQRVKLSI